ncbi:MAG: UDP-N-acetylmuramate:L-alanyl-gamma-D-glutamyl-meso-diaminopimelate ligase [Chromatiales bacterium]|nr:UDP-N-acetylmuramate:L-alanyl-gamma-D-glutamyl-meso-diaminopimelate ligase [Chromatiales bacterium]
MRHLHILGICGTFMAGVAALARAAGWRVTGADRNVYPPMSDQLAALGIAVHGDFEASQLEPAPDLVAVGNVMTRGMPVVEALLDSRIPFMSGPEWLAKHVLADRHVLAVSGTHGKTTTTSMLAWILHAAGHDAGFLVGGLPGNFPGSAHLGSSPFFVLEADEYDTAFFDKRPKFLLYHPRTLVINNIEFDHADIYPDLAAIIRQFHLLLRSVPRAGRVIVPADDANVAMMLAQGCWTPVERFSSAAEGDPGVWQARVDAGGRLLVRRDGSVLAGPGAWPLSGEHNAENAMGALLAAAHVGIPVEQGLAALSGFRGVRRRLEPLGSFRSIRVYDDFAHHPTAIRRTLEGLRASSRTGRIVAVLEPRSNTMRLGAHGAALAQALAAADLAFLLEPPGLDWDLASSVAAHPAARVVGDGDALLELLLQELEAGDQVVLMSNGAFENLRERLPSALSSIRAG